MTVGPADVLALVALVAVLGWRRARQLADRLTLLERRMTKLQETHDAFVIFLSQDDDPTDPRMLS